MAGQEQSQIYTQFYLISNLSPPFYYFSLGVVWSSRLGQQSGSRHKPIWSQVASSIGATSNLTTSSLEFRALSSSCRLEAGQSHIQRKWHLWSWKIQLRVLGYYHEMWVPSQELHCITLFHSFRKVMNPAARCLFIFFFESGPTHTMEWGWG